MARKVTKTAKPASSAIVRRLDVAARAALASVGGYAGASLAAALLARILPGPVAEATTAAMLLSFAAYAALAIWSFADPRLLRLVLGFGLGGAALAGALWLSLQVEPRL